MIARSSLVTGTGLALGSMFSAQLGAVLSVPLLLAEGALGSTALRLACAAAASLLWVRPRLLSYDARQWASAAALGLAMAVTTTGFFAATTRIPVGAAITIDFLGPLSVAALALRGYPRIVLPTLAAGGVVAVALGDGGSLLDPLGLLFALAAAVGWASYILLMRRVGALFSAQDGLCLALVVAALAVVPVAVAVEPTWHVATRLPHLAALAFLTPFLPFVLEMSALRRIPVGPFSILMSLEPAFGVLLGYAVLGQTLSLRQSFGIVAVIGASIAAILLSSAGRAGSRSSQGGRGAQDG